MSVAEAHPARARLRLPFMGDGAPRAAEPAGHVAGRLTRAAGPVALALFVGAGIASTQRPLVMAVVAGFVAVGVCAVVALRPATGWRVFAAIAIAASAVAVICSGSQSANLGWFAMCLLAGWCALQAGTRQAVWLCGGIVVFLVAEGTLVSNEVGWGAWIVGTIFSTVVCVLARRQRELLEQLRTAQAGLADRARLEERTRIAREMHDVVGHALTVSLLHVSSARLALDEDLDEARSLLAEAERLGRRSLTEVRQTVGVLRADEPSLVVPMPDVDQLHDLVESFRRAGTAVTVEVSGDVAALTATGGLAVYRILQEALTNVVRHTPRATAHVCLAVIDDGVRLVVDSVDSGRAADLSPGPVGAGIRGMRERAEALGGQLTTGPVRGGWRVEATLPVLLAPVSAESP